MLNSGVYGISVVLGVHGWSAVRIVIGVSMDTAVQNASPWIVIGAAVGAVKSHLVRRQKTQRTEVFADF